jgi:hypothetical protein
MDRNVTCFLLFLQKTICFLPYASTITHASIERDMNCKRSSWRCRCFACSEDAHVSAGPVIHIYSGSDIHSIKHDRPRCTQCKIRYPWAAEPCHRSRQAGLDDDPSPRIQFDPAIGHSGSEVGARLVVYYKRKCGHQGCERKLYWSSSFPLNLCVLCRPCKCTV